MDNDLSKDIAVALRVFGFDILHISETPDLPDSSYEPEIFKWCALHGRTWITHDYEANKKHAADLKASKVSALWVRGNPDGASTWTFFKLLVRNIDLFQQKLSNAHGAIHYKAIRGEQGLVFMWAESQYDRPKGGA